MLTVGSRLTDFATGSQSLFENPDVRFASINVNVHDADTRAGRHRHPRRRQARPGRPRRRRWQGHSTSRRPGRTRSGPRSRRAGRRSGPPRSTRTPPFDKRADRPTPDVVPTPTRCSPRAQLIGLLQEHARSGDTIIAAAGGPPGDLQKVWDATDGRTATWSSGSPAWATRSRPAWACGWPNPNPDTRVVAVHRRRHVPDGAHRAGHRRAGGPRRHHGGPGEPRLPGDPPAADGPQRHASSATSSATAPPAAARAADAAARPRLDGDYLEVDLVQVAAGPRRPAIRATTAAEVRAALDDTRGHQGPVVIVVPADPARRPARRRRVVGRRPGRGVRPGMGAARCAPSTSRHAARQRWFG